jgi:5-methylcytosine-specific restriction endonuclease McrA
MTPFAENTNNGLSAKEKKAIYNKTYNKKYAADHIDKIKAYRHEYYIANKEAHDEQTKAWAEANKESRDASCKKWRLNNREKANAASVKWQKNNKERVKFNNKEYLKTHLDDFRRKNHERRARLRNVAVEKFKPSEIFERDNWMCQLCGKRVDKHLKRPNPLSASLDHIVPLSKGGSHSRANTHLAHLTCNLRAHVGGIKQTRLF